MLRRYAIDLTPLAIDGAGNLFVADRDNDTIRPLEED